MKKILITGSTGQLGSELTKILISKDFNLIPVSRSQLDIANYFQVEQLLLNLRPDWVVNCAAFTNLDRAETQVDESNKVNSVGPSLLARACEITGSKLLHFSTDAVFSSSSFKFFSSKESTNPVSQYGKSKEMGEKILLNNFAKNIWIIRSSWLYGDYGGNFIHKIIQSIRKQESIQVVDDQFGQPTNTRNFGLHIKEFISEPPNSGVYHFADFGYTSRYDLAKEISLSLGYKKYNIVPKSTVPSKNVAVRPKYSLLSLDNDSIKVDTKFIPWQDSLNQFLKLQTV